MTPLARRITLDAMLPPDSRAFDATRGAAPDLTGASAFDVSGVYDLAYELARDVGRFAGTPAAAALPSSRTWIEWVLPGRRAACFLESAGGSDLVAVTEILDDPTQAFLGTWTQYRIRLSGEGAGLIPEPPDERRPGWYLDGFSPVNLVPAFLLLLNAPTDAGRSSVVAHGGSGMAAH